MSSSGIPLGHKFTAVLVAAAVGGGVYAFLSRRAAQSASTAELSYDAHAARRIDPGFVQAHDPAVALAQSILTDTMLANVSKSSYLSTTAMMSRIGEFRSRLELTQPSEQVLRVRFEDANPTRAGDTANAIARALAAWTPPPSDAPVSSDVAEPTAVAPPPAARQPAVPPVNATPKPATHTAPAAARHASEPAPQASSALATALGDLAAQLSATDRKLDQLGGGHGGYERYSHAESQQQQLIKGQVRTAEKTVSDLRATATGSDRQRLGTVQEALASILSGSGAGVSERQLRREREGMTRAVGVVQEQQRAVEKETSAAPPPDAEAPAETPAPATSSGSATQTPAAASGSGSASGSGAISESNVSGSGAPSPASTPNAAPASAPGAQEPGMPGPLRVIRLAGPVTPVVWWIPAAAGVVCLLFYLLIASGRSRHAAYEYEEESDTGGLGTRLITPDAPPVVRDPAPSTADFFGGGSSRRASFTYEPSPEERGGTMTALVEEETVAAAPDETPAPRPEPAKAVDPWADLMQRALAETEIGRSFEGGSQEKGKSAGAEKDESPPRTRFTDRLAG